MLIIASLLAGCAGVYIYSVFAVPTHNIAELFNYAAAGISAFAVIFSAGWRFYFRKS